MGTGSSRSRYNDYGYGECCDAVVDPLSLLAALGAIAAVSLFLRQAVIDNMIMAGRRRRQVGQELSNLLQSGKQDVINDHLFGLLSFLPIPS